MKETIPNVDLVIRNVRTDRFNGLTDLAIHGGKFYSIGSGLAVQGAQELDAEGQFASPPFIDPHTHLDKAFLQPETNVSGSLNEAIQIMGRHKDMITGSDFDKRVDRALSWAMERGTLAVRTHVDVDSITQVKSVSQMLEARQRWEGVVDLQIVAFPQEGLLRDPDAVPFLRRAMELGADIVGGIPAIESTEEAKKKHIRIIFDLAKEFDADVDMHIDENLDPSSRTLELLAEATIEAGLQGRVSAAHCSALSVYDDDYARIVVEKVKEAGIHVIANPSSNLVLLGRDHGHPLPRGLTRIKELLDAGVNVSCGQDNLRDVFYPLGQADMLEAAFLTAVAAQMTGIQEMQFALDMPRYSAAKILKIKDYGLREGAPADLVLFPAESPADALASRSPRWRVYRRGKLIFECNVDKKSFRPSFTSTNE